MKQIMTLALLAVGTLTVKAAGDVEVVAKNGTVSATISEGICKLTVKPDDGYYITQTDIIVTKLADASLAGSRTRTAGPKISDAIKLEGDEPSNLSDERIYTFRLPGEDYDYKVEATFKQKKIEVKNVPSATPEGGEGAQGGGDSETPTPETTLAISVSNDNNVTQKEVTVVDEATGEEITKTVSVVEVSLDNISLADDTGGGGGEGGGGESGSTPEAPQQISVSIPASIASADGTTEYAITSIGSGVLNNLPANVEVSEIQLPTTEDVINIASDAFKVDDLPADDPAHQVLTIKSPLEMLDDYTLKGDLKENVEAGKLKATVKAPNHYWTFACGIDVLVPDGIGVYICKMDNETEVQIIPLTDDQLMVEGKRVMKKNNGLLIGCIDDSDGNAYDIVAAPNNDATGAKPATEDAKDYEGNLLEPVIEKKNYSSKDYYVMKDNEFHLILDNDSTTPACKAVLRKPKK